MALRDFAYRCCSIALSVHEFGEVVCPLFIVGLDAKSTSRAIVKCRPVRRSCEEDRYPLGGLVEQFEHRH